MMQIIFFVYLFLLSLPALPNDDRIQEILESLATVIFEGEKQEIVDSFLENGLGQVESEASFRKFSHSAASCVVEAIRSYSAERSLDFENQLEVLETSLETGDAESYLDSFDDEDMYPIVNPCMSEAFREAGLEFN